MIVGAGTDMGRLERKVQALGVAQHVRFTGLIAESEKDDYYRLADAFVMPSRGEGFGFVLLEAMACGIPVVASVLDGGREAVRYGQLGLLIDPTARNDVKRGIRDVLTREKGRVPEGLEFFAFANFEERAAAIIRETVRIPLVGGRPLRHGADVTTQAAEK